MQDRVRVIWSESAVVFTPPPLLDSVPSMHIVVYAMSNGLYKVKLYPSSGMIDNADSTRD